MENKISISEKISSMTAKEIIMSMVEGLRNPTTEINMRTFGKVVDGVCFGCAATNTICKIGGYTTTNLLKVDGIASNLDGSLMVMHFEWAIDELRRGRLDNYNYQAGKGGFAKIILPDGVPNYTLPYLADDYTEEELDCYVELADMQ